MSKARETAVNILDQVYDGGYLNIILKNELSSLEPLDRRFCARLVNTVLDNSIKIDYVIDYFTEGNRIHRLIRNILRIGVCQIMFFDGIPVSAAVNECVKICEMSSKRQLKGFVNAVLRRIATDYRSVVYPSETVNNISISYSYPEWITSKFIDEYGIEFTRSLFSYKDLSTCIRVNFLKTSNLNDICKYYDIAREGRYVDGALYVDNISQIESSEPYINGLITVQSESSMLAAEACNVQEGEHVYDSCSAPGGKSAYIAQKRPGRLVCNELHPHRAELIRKNFIRLGIDDYEIRISDASIPDPSLYESFDVVLVDAPCSALGLMYRKPDIKLNRKAEDLLELASIDYEILETSSRNVRPGGRLIYSTCTIDRAENEDVLFKFLSEHPDFSLGELMLPGFDKKRTDKGFIQFYPHIDGLDGFFISCIIKKR